MSRFVYMDESGDPGLKLGSSKYFVVSAIVIYELDDKNKLEEALNFYKKGLGWSEDKELKFNKSGEDAIRLAIRAVKSHRYEAMAMVLDKRNPTFEKARNNNKELAPLLVFGELLKRMNIENSEIVIDGAYGRKYATKARTYLRQSLKENGLQGNEIHFIDSKKSSLIQLADLLSGAVAKSLSGSKKDQEFVKLFGDKIKNILKY